MVAITNDLGAASAAAGSGSMTKTRASCVRLGADVRKAKAYGPIPAADVQTHWSAALGKFGKAATDCINGIDRGDTTLIDRSATEMTDGGADIVEASTALSAY